MTLRSIQIAEGVFVPRPGAPHMDNLIATMWLDGNRAAKLDLDLIADNHGFNRAEFAARFAHIETAAENDLWEHTRKPVEYGEDGK
jgi:hypothetical protein